MRLQQLIRLLQHRKVVDWLVSVLWMSLLFSIVVWSAWIVLTEKYNIQALKAVKESTEFTVEAFTVKQFGPDEKTQKALAGDHLHFEPTTQTFTVEQPVGDGVFFSKSKQEWSQIYTTGSQAIATKTSSTPNVIVQNPRLNQQFSNETVQLAAEHGTYQDRFVTASGDVFFRDNTKNLRAGQLKYDISQGSVEILGRTPDGKTSKETSGRVRLELEMPESSSKNK
jgi:LPS export ABC transporter protein LptC